MSGLAQTRPAAPARTVEAQPQVSVILPVRDGAHYLSRTLPVLRRELPAGWELIVVDDHSTDASRRVASGYADRVLESPGRANDNIARNGGAHAARGDILVFIDADIRVTREALERLVRGLGMPGVTMTVGIYSEDSGLATVCGCYKNLWVRHSYLKSGTELRWMNTAFAAIRRSDFLDTGDYEAFEGCRWGGSDIDFGRRIADRGGRVLLLKDVGVDHLKEMSFLALLRNDFNRTRGFFRMALHSGEIRKVAGGRSYGNIRPGFMVGVVSAALVPFGLIAALVAPRIALPVTAAALVVQQIGGLGFFAYAMPRMNRAAWLVPPLYLADQLACATGLAAEVMNLLFGRRTLRSNLTQGAAPRSVAVETHGGTANGAISREPVALESTVRESVPTPGA